MKAIRAIGFITPSPIQDQVIPHILAGTDVVAQAQTGTGKTAAFGLPALNMLNGESGVEMVVITPTRELAQQVSDELFKYGGQSGLRTVTVYGGQSVTRQIETIKKGAQVVVATPGRLLDLLKSKRMPYFRPKVVVLDEADEMLDMGFLDDIKEIFTFMPEERQTLLFSATMPAPIQALAKKILKKPVFIKVTQDEVTNQDIEQRYYVIKDAERDVALIRLIDFHLPEKSLIFCKTKKEVDRLTEELAVRGHPVKGLHGDMEQNQRQRVIGSFRDGETKFLVATDVAARGLNIVDISHVFNFHMPFESNSYVHRIGRTGRAGRKGIAITLLTQGEFRTLQQMIKTHGTSIQLCAIPRLSEIKQNHRAKFIESICERKPSPDADLVLKELHKLLNPNQIGLHLISMLLEKQELSGPDQIGVQAEDLDKLAHRMASQPAEKSGRQFKRKRGPYPSAAKRRDKTRRF